MPYYWEDRRPKQRGDKNKYDKDTIKKDEKEVEDLIVECFRMVPDFEKVKIDTYTWTDWIKSERHVVITTEDDGASYKDRLEEVIGFYGEQLGSIEVVVSEDEDNVVIDVVIH